MDFNLSNFSGFVDVPITSLAPKCFAIWSPIRPTPELAPCIKIVCPLLKLPIVTIALCIVARAIGNVLAVAKSILLSGIFITLP